MGLGDEASSECLPVLFIPVFAAPVAPSSCNITLLYDQPSRRLQSINTTWDLMIVSHTTGYAIFLFPSNGFTLNSEHNYQYFYFKIVHIHDSTSWDIRGHPGMSHPGMSQAVLGPRVSGPRCPRISRGIPVLDIPGCPRPGGRVKSQVKDVLGHPGTSWDVPGLETVLSPRVPGPRCPGISRDIPGCPRPGGSVRSQSPRSKMS